jgi:apolipoprotein N-acyltransferase
LPLAEASRRYGDLLAFVAGMLTPLGFAPFHFFPLAILGPAVLFLVWLPASAGRAAWRGFIYGLGFFGVGVSWIYVSLHTFGNMPAPLAALAVLLFVAALALYMAALGALQSWFRDLPIGARLLLVLPATWVMFEWTRGWFLTGFPWLNLGYSQTDTVLSGFLPWGGVYAASFAVAITAGALAAAWRERGRAWTYLASAAVIWILGWVAAQPQWVTPAATPLRVALVQGNVPLSIKWRPEYREKIIDSYVQLSAQVNNADLVVWPESAVPGFFHIVGNKLMSRLDSLRHRGQPDFIIGAVEYDGQQKKYYNSVFVVGEDVGTYRKRHLVPFGEFLPLSSVFGWLLATLEIPMSDFAAGTSEQAPLVAAGQPIGVSVCYEDAFGEEVAMALPRATILVNVSEDAWFGNSLAPHQRLQMARVRAMESGRPMVRAANTGPSAIIDHRGQVVAGSPQFEPFILEGEIQPMVGATPFVHSKNAPIVLLLMGIIVAATVWRCRRLAK